jgi:hypothetical protein
MRDKYNAGWIGLLSGLLVPFVGYAVLLMIDEKLGLMDVVGSTDPALQERTRALLAICLNILPLRYFNKWRSDRSIRTLVIVTLGYAGLWFYLYGSQLLG